MSRLENKFSIITGGASGIGEAISKIFHQEGSNICVIDNNKNKLENFEKSIDSKDDVLTFSFDVSDENSWKDCIKEVLNTWGKIDVLVNNAGMSPLYDNLASVSESLYDKVLGVNLKGPFRLTALIGSRMVEGDGGSVIMVSSMASVRPGKNALPYAAAKAGLNAITIGFAQAYGPKVRVNGIVAGPFLTDIAKAWDMENFEKRAEESIPLGRAGDPHEIVGAALYFASAASSYTTGALLQVAGGS